MMFSIFLFTYAYNVKGQPMKLATSFGLSFTAHNINFYLSQLSSGNVV